MEATEKVQSESLNKTITQFESIKKYSVAESKYLVQCVLQLTSSFGCLSEQQYTIDQIYNTKSIIYILHEMCPQQFQIKISNSEMQNVLTEYFYNQFGYYIRPLLNADNYQQKIIIVVLYACIYSTNKQKFVDKIMKLPSQIQQKLVSEIEKVQKQLKQLRGEKQLIQTIIRLQTENNQLKNALILETQQKQLYEGQLKIVNDELEETKRQRNEFVLQKRKILSKFKLSNLAEYQDLCKKLANENENLAKRQQNLLQMIQNLQNQISNLKQGLKSCDSVIYTLTESKNEFARKCEQLTNEISTYQDSLINVRESSNINNSKDAKQSQVTQDETQIKQSTIMNMGRKSRFNDQQLLLNSKSSGFSLMARQSKQSRQSRNSVRNIFVQTKNTILMQEKIQLNQQQIELLKLKISQLQFQIGKLSHKQKFYIKNNRKIQKLSDQFRNQYFQIPQIQLDI